MLMSSCQSTVKSNTITSDYHTELDKGTLTLLLVGKKQSAARGGPGSLKATPLVRLAAGGGGGWRGEFDRQKNMGVAKICHKMITES